MGYVVKYPCAVCGTAIGIDENGWDLGVCFDCSSEGE